jgi:hypothetical protein
MIDQYDRHGDWNLTKEVDLSPWWSVQDQTWHRCNRGWFLVTVGKSDGKAGWYAVRKQDGIDLPDWYPWDFTLPSDLVPVKNFDMTGEFDLDDIELAELFMEEL